LKEVHKFSEEMKLREIEMKKKLTVTHGPSLNASSLFDKEGCCGAVNDKLVTTIWIDRDSYGQRHSFNIVACPSIEIFAESCYVDAPLKSISTLRSIGWSRIPNCSIADLKNFKLFKTIFHVT
jgi:hypothetical protein